jgi:hypothetical protein
MTTPIFEIFLDEDDTYHTRCPKCKSEDSIVERDVAVRWNRLTLHDDGYSATTSTGDFEGVFEGDGFLCTFCMTDVDAPEGFEILDWS